MAAKKKQLSRKISPVEPFLYIIPFDTARFPYPEGTECSVHTTLKDMEELEGKDFPIESVVRLNMITKEISVGSIKNEIYWEEK